MIVLTGLRSEQYTLQIIDIAGRVALNETISGNAAGVEVTLNNLQSGAYIVRVFNDAGSQSARLILEGR
ncbi:MAG: T9SS type A sorting domain-containing protein [Flavobacteriales bacterium]